MKIEFGHGTHIGLRRDHNEDTYCAEPELGLWLVADGMGGHAHGEVASAIARDTISKAVKGGYSLREAILLADETILEHSGGPDSDMLPMGTTVVVAKADADELKLAWVGDSRIYVWDQELTQLSNDHSYVQELVEQGAISAEQARTHPHRNVVTQALGVTIPEELHIETASYPAHAGIRLLLCSDGLTEDVDDNKIAALLSKDLSPQEAVDHLILEALDGGGSDNITVVVLDILASA